MVLSCRGDGTCWSGWRQGEDAGERAGDVLCPGPGRRDFQVPAALAFDDPPGGVQDLVAQGLWFCFGQVAVEGEEPQPGQQVTGDGGGLAPGGIDLVVSRGQMSQAGAFRAADLVFDSGLGSVAGFEELDLPAGGVGGGDLVALALVLLEQGQLGAGVGVLPADDDPHVRRPPGEAVTAGAVAQQPGQLGDLRVRPRCPVGVQRRGPRRFWQPGQDRADPLIEVEPCRVMHLVPGAGAELGDVLDQGVGGSGAVAGEQHPAAVPGGDLRDRGVHDGEVVGGGVTARVPGPQHHRERLIGVVAPGRQRMMAPGALERAPGLLLVTVRHDDRGVQADHGHAAQIPPGHLRRRNAAVPRLDQRPYVTAGLRPGLADPGQGHAVASGQCPPRRRVGGDRAEQLALMAQRVNLADRRRAVGDRDGQVGEHPAPVMQRAEPPPGQRAGQRPGQPGPVREQPGRRRPYVRHDPVPAGFNVQTLRPRHRIHGKGASPSAVL